MSETRRLRDRALDHPVRRQISAMLSGKELSTEEVAARLDGPTCENVASHLKVLGEVGLVKRMGGLWWRPSRRQGARGRGAD